MQITNLQSAPMTFVGEVGGLPVEHVIPPGGMRDLPAEVWDRYADRRDVKAMHGHLIFIGELSEEAAAKMGDTAQTALLAAAREDLARARMEFDADVTKRRDELRDMERLLASQREDLDLERATFEQEKQARAQLTAHGRTGKSKGKG